MQREQQEELWRLTEEARKVLDAPVELSGYLPRVFSFWRLPAFHNLTRTTLYAPGCRRESKQPFFTVTTWRRDVDQDKLRDPIERLRHPRILAPTMEESRVEVSTEVVAGLVAELSGIALPVLRPDEGLLGTDGIDFRFSFSQGFYALDLKWWGDGPRCWRAATERIVDLVDGLEALGHRSEV